MLITKNRKDNLKSIYMCDRCKKEISIKERKGIYVTSLNTTIPKKKWDFCISCYKSLVRGVEKGRMKKQEGTDD